jgi:hypothetical protein
MNSVSDVLLVCEPKEKTSSMFIKCGKYKTGINCSTLDPTSQQTGMAVNTALPNIVENGLSCQIK